MTRPYAVRTVDPIVRELQRQAEQFAEPVSPYAANSPYKTSPYVKCGPYARRSPYAPATPASGRTARPGRGTAVRKPVRHITHVVIAGRRPGPRTEPLLLGSVSLRWLDDHDENNQHCSVMDPGDYWDFSAWGLSLAWYDHCVAGWCALDEDDPRYIDSDDAMWADPEHEHPVALMRIREGRPYSLWGDEITCGFEYDTDDWAAYFAQWCEVWAVCMAEPVARLEAAPQLCDRVLRRAGYTLPGFALGPAEIGAAVMEDRSLRSACGDVLTEHYGEDFPELQAAYAEAFEEWGYEPVDWPCAQFFCPVRRQPVIEEPGYALRGWYRVADISYHSLVDEPDPHAPDGLLNWRVLEIEPCDKDGNFI